VIELLQPGSWSRAWIVEETLRTTSVGRRWTGSPPAKPSPRRRRVRKGVDADGGSVAAAATVRRGSAAKPLAELDFGIDADDADGADGCAPAFSGVEWLGVVGDVDRGPCPSLAP
jgi:hypothetical protein